MCGTKGIKMIKCLDLLLDNYKISSANNIPTFSHKWRGREGEEQDDGH